MPSSFRRIVFAASALVLGLIVTLVLAEGMIRLAARPGSSLEERLRPYDPFAIRIEPHGEHGYRPKPGVVIRYRNGTSAHINERRFRGQVPDSIRTPQSVRVVLLGGSTTFGWGVEDDATIDAHLRGLLDSMLPDRGIEVLNAAFDGYDSYQLLERLRSDVLTLNPDLIVVNSGINDVRSARYDRLVEADPRTLYLEMPMRRMREEKARGRPYFWSRAKHASYLLRLLGLTRDLVLRRAGALPLPAQRYKIYPDAADPTATEPYWARFYDITTNRPIFAGAQDGIIYDSFEEMWTHNRFGYDYYTRRPAGLLTKERERWRKMLAKGAAKKP